VLVSPGRRVANMKTFRNFIGWVFCVVLGILAVLLALATINPHIFD